MSGIRNLPSWMSASVSERRKGEPVSSSGRHRRDVNIKSSRTKRAPRTLMYWMNERELVDTALSVLNGSDVKTGACLTGVTEMRVIPETDTEEEPDLDAEERTCDSNSDVNVAEQETVPYTTCFVKETANRKSDQGGNHHLTHSKISGKETELEGSSQSSKPDHEAMQLVHEIFFS